MSGYEAVVALAAAQDFRRTTWTMRSAIWTGIPAAAEPLATRGAPWLRAGADTERARRCTWVAGATCCW